MVAGIISGLFCICKNTELGKAMFQLSLRKITLTGWKEREEYFSLESFTEEKKPMIFKAWAEMIVEGVYDSGERMSSHSVLRMLKCTQNQGIMWYISLFGLP